MLSRHELCHALSSPGSGPSDDPPRSKLTCDKVPWLVRQAGAPPTRLAETDRMWASGCRSALPGLSASPQVRDRARPLWRGEACALSGVLVPHRLPPPRTDRCGVRFPAGAHRARRSCQRPPRRPPPVGDGVWMTSTTPRSHCRSPSGRTQLLAALTPRTVTRWDRQAVTTAGRQTSRDVLSPGNRGFHRTFPTPKTASPRSVSAHLRTGRHHGEAVGELPASPPRSP